MNRTHALVGSLLVVASLAGLAVAQDSDRELRVRAHEDDLDHPTRKELNEARREAGLTLSTVVYDRAGKRWRIECDPSEKAQQAMADDLCAQVCAEASKGPLTIEPATIEDALVVLRFETNNTAALALVRARYAELRQAARQKRAGR